ncbi:formate dehydrogenase accessory sulfurtransferase FdhD [Tistrella bauzanensis]|nr:formate dehydrogenase accessory sulfurtransferase FdhD [Tistrella bauzanensis]
MDDRAAASPPMPPSDGDIGPLSETRHLRWRAGQSAADDRVIPEETAIAFTYNGSTHAVMMASPADLEDLAVGFSLGEAIIDEAGQIEAIDAVAVPDGIDLRIWLSAERAAGLIERRRHVAGPTGCGLCGIDSLAAAMRPPPAVGPGIVLTPGQVAEALDSLPPAQHWGRISRAMHAAAFWHPARGLVLLREDVGRHNALDKLAGGLARAGINAADGVLVITSRVSIEMVQKAARIGVSVMIAVSAPTALAVRMAEAAGLTLIAIARADGFEIFTRPDRVPAAEQGMAG